MVTVATSGAVLRKCGINVPSHFSGANAEANINPIILEAEAYLNDISRYNWISNWSSLNSGAALLGQEFVASIAAIEIIKYDMNSYTTRVEAEDMINVLAWRVHQIENHLRDQNTMSYIAGA